MRAACRPTRAEHALWIVRLQPEDRGDISAPRAAIQRFKTGGKAREGGVEDGFTLRVEGHCRDAMVLYTRDVPSLCFRM